MYVNSYVLLNIHLGKQLYVGKQISKGTNFRVSVARVFKPTPRPFAIYTDCQTFLIVRFPFFILPIQAYVHGKRKQNFLTNFLLP